MRRYNKKLLWQILIFLCVLISCQFDRKRPWYERASAAQSYEVRDRVSQPYIKDFFKDDELIANLLSSPLDETQQEELKNLLKGVIDEKRMAMKKHNPQLSFDLNIDSEILAAAWSQHAFLIDLSKPISIYCNNGRMLNEDALDYMLSQLFESSLARDGVNVNIPTTLSLPYLREPIYSSNETQEEILDDVIFPDCF